jgi:hypothetical protein
MDALGPPFADSGVHVEEGRQLVQVGLGDALAQLKAAHVLLQPLDLLRAL